MSTIRLARPEDLAQLLGLYEQLTNRSIPNEIPAQDEALAALWREILDNPNYHVVVAEAEGRAVSTCTLVIVANLTHNQRPYALVENVVTDRAYRKRGLGSAVLAYAREIALRRGCYKMMLMTGTRLESTLRFYERAGYNREDKTGFIQWLE